jgi:hypothetical protein
MPLLTAAQRPKRGASAGRPQSNPPSVRFASGQSALKIPFELSNNIILVQSQVNDSRPLWFIFDTGANSSVINARLVKELNLQTRGRVGGAASGGKIEAELITGVTLAVPGVSVSQQTIASLPMDVFSMVFGKSIDGIIGYDFIRQFVVEIDYAAKVMHLYAPASFNRPVSGETLPIRFINRKPFVNAKIKLEERDAVEGAFMIDTGGDTAMSINAPFVKQHQFLKSLPIVQQSISGGAGGTSKSITARVVNIQLGQFIINNPLVEFSQATEGTETLSTYAGLLGGEVFRRFTLILDYARQRIILEPNAAFPEPVEADMSGLDLMADGEDLKIVVINEVAAGSPGEMAGLKGEDELLAVDGQPVSELGLGQVRQVFKRQGKEYSLSIKRGEQTLQVKIKLRRLM